MRGNGLPWSPVKDTGYFYPLLASTYFIFYGVVPNASASQLACLISVRHFWKGEKGGGTLIVSGIPYLESSDWTGCLPADTWARGQA